MKTKGLTIQEAIQSGLPFKRKHEAIFCSNHTRAAVIFSTNDVLATDWEIKVPEVTITREKLAEAWFQIGPPFKRPEECNLFHFVCNKLGL